MIMSPNVPLLSPGLADLLARDITLSSTFSLSPASAPSSSASASSSSSIHSQYWTQDQVSVLLVADLRPLITLFVSPLISLLFLLSVLGGFVFLLGSPPPISASCWSLQWLSCSW